MATYSGLTHKQTAPLVHILGIVSIVLVIIWTYHYRGGYGLSGGPVFNVSLLMESEFCLVHLFCGTCAWLGWEWVVFSWVFSSAR